MLSLMAHTRPGRVYRLRIVPDAQQSLLETTGEQILARVATGNRVTTYQRTWIVGPTEFADGVLSGRIGYQGEDGTAEIWDDAAQDFVETAVPQGLTAPFAIDLDALSVAVQPRGGLIKVQSLVNAFERLLSVEPEKWKLVGFKTPLPLAEWKASVDRIVSVKFVVKVPNPNYHGATNVQELIEVFAAQNVSLEAQNPNGVDLDSPIVEETEGHIARGYGEAEYHGIRKTDGHETVYSTAIGSEEQYEESAVDPATGEVSTDNLRQILATEDDNGKDDRQDGREGPALA
jgi:hypothetical protein